GDDDVVFELVMAAPRDVAVVVILGGNPASGDATDVIAAAAAVGALHVGPDLGDRGSPVVPPGTCTGRLTWPSSVCSARVVAPRTRRSCSTAAPTPVALCRWHLRHEGADTTTGPRPLRRREPGQVTGWCWRQRRDSRSAAGALRSG